MAVIYRFPSGEKVHGYEEHQLIQDTERKKRAEIHWLFGLDSPLIGFIDQNNCSALSAASETEASPRDGS